MQRTPGPLGSYVESWAPEAVTDADDLTAAPVAALSALLDEPAPVATTGDTLPPLWHWLYFLRRPAQRDLGPVVKFPSALRRHARTLTAPGTDPSTSSTRACARHAEST
ncbi:hypothetical protein ABZ656_01825, partial [Streptomyces sp. NPDC007095]